MKLDLFNIKEFIDVNHLQEVTNPVLMEKDGSPHKDGLISNEIFGITTKSRKETFAYIKLYGHYFHPHIYKVIKRMFKNIDSIISGEKYYSINSEGVLTLDDVNGETGIEFLYDNWDKINWYKGSNSSMRNEREFLINNTNKDIIFIEYQIVCPVYYRDVKTKQSGGNVEDDINKMYSTLLRLTSTIRDQYLFSFQFNNTNMSIQNTIVQIYDYFKNKLSGKTGLIKRYLLGKSCDYCTRTVITAETFGGEEKPSDRPISFEYSSIPISHALALCYPFVVKYVSDFFQREFVDNQYNKIIYDPASDNVIGTSEIKDPGAYFSDRYIEKMINTFIKDPESRFTKIKVPTKDGSLKYVAFTGRRYVGRDTSELSTIMYRPMCWTDLLYMACVDVTRDKHCLITRYPVLNEYGTFITRINISSTLKTMPVLINDRVYKFYPVIEYDTPEELIGTKFIDSVRFSNSYLKGLDGDYDGDTTTVKVAFTQEANEELENYMYHKDNFISADGGNIRDISKEAFQTFYVMSKNPDDNSKTISKEDKQMLIDIGPDDITFSKLCNWFGDLKNIEKDGKNVKANKCRFNCNDKLTLTPEDCPIVRETVNTTVGRYVFNKLLVMGPGFDSFIEYNNDVLTAGAIKKFEKKIINALLDDKISSKQMIHYIDMRNFLGLELHAVITSSFSEKVLKLPKEVKTLKNELLKKYEKEIADGDIKVIDNIAKTLIDKEMEVLSGDYGLDLYQSGARGSVDNHLKNMQIMRGAVFNTGTNSYDIITNSLMDGLDRKDLAAHCSSIVVGSYARGIKTADSGYKTKEILASCGAEIIDDNVGSDCGSIGYLLKTITKDNSGDFLYRYIIEGNKLVLLDRDNISKYYDKEVKLRSPMYCKGVNGNQHIYCNKCVGDYYYKLGKRNIGLLASTITGVTMKASLAKFHDSQVKFYDIDIDDMLI